MHAAPKIDLAHFPQSVCAQILGISDAHFSKLVKDGVLPPQAKRRDGWDIRAVAKAYLAYRLNLATPTSLVEVRKRIDLEDLRARTLKNDLLEGDLLRRPDVERTFDEAMVIIANGMDALGGRIAGEFAGISEPAVIRKRTMEETRSIRADAADKLRAVARDIRARRGAATAAA